MKNIHVLPTDKPSRLWINNLLQGKLELSKEVLIGSNTSQHIHITSNDNNNITDEGVQHIAGTWVLDTTNNKVFKTSVNIISDDDIQKIILTTDQDLIADGVQAIDDEFLEYFVNNPSCEAVEVTKMLQVRHGHDWYDLPNQEEGKEMDGIYRKIYKIIEPKQETLEEVAERLYPIIETDNYMDMYDKNFDIRKSFIEGAKWQQERMYSEEEVELIANEMVNWTIDNIGNPNPQSGKKFDEVIAKFRKK